MIKQTHSHLRSLIMSYGTATYHYHSCFHNISTGPFKGKPTQWWIDKENKKEAMEKALKACMDEIENRYERKLK